MNSMKQSIRTSLFFSRSIIQKKIKEMALGILSESQETCTMEKINYTKGIAQGIREVRNFFHAIRDEYKKRIKANDER